MSRFSVARAVSVGIAIALGAIAFGAAGGTQTGRAAPVEVAVLVVAGLLLALGLIAHDWRRQLYGGLSVTLLAVFTIVVGLSTGWSVTPDLSLQEMSRDLSYLAVFAVAVMAPRYLPRGAQSVLTGILIAALAVCAWALATRIWPASLGGDVLGARLGEPFDYWNALGGMAALAVPGALWLGSRREGSELSSALAYPALGVLVLTVLLTQSRGALAAVVLAALGWLAFVPLRLRSAPVLVVGVIAVAPVAAWALSRDAFTKALQTLEERQAVAGDFGLLVLATVVFLFIAGFAVVRVRSRTTFSLETRRRAGIAMAAVLVVLMVAGVVGASVSGGGLGNRLDDLTSARSSVSGSGAGRLGSTSSSRGEYWRQAFDVFKDRPLVGRGADGFTLARLPYRKDPNAARHAHGFVPQTMADLGLLGLLVVLALFAAWSGAAARTLGARRRGSPGPDWTHERLALTGLGICVAAYGLQSSIDWTWFVPGPTVAGLAAAGFLAGRGPLRRAGASPEVEPQDGSEAEGSRQRLLYIRGADPLRLIGAGAVLVTALLCAWVAWQPQRSASATDRAIGLADSRDYVAAVRQADHARAIDPYSADPLYARATALSGAGRPLAAYRALEQAVAEHPRDPETWLRLGSFEFRELDLPGRALESSTAAYAIDPRSTRAPILSDAARARLENRPIPHPVP